MKTKKTLFPGSGVGSFLLALALVAFAMRVEAQQYSIPWYDVAGGGGGGSGGAGAYSVTGTIGQPDAGAAMINAPYVVVGGFWSVLGARPSIMIWIQGNDVIVAWPVTAGASQLQQAGNMTTPVWSDVIQTPVIVGEEYQVTVPLAGFQQYFRLIQQ